ncbi:MAG TPA: VapC toxin family PIN domain ribonuclease [Kosmotogaceae bacterium]|nr:VapC toxin family PIN domain ribonuclease [Kosmotogaceae bacterium]
MDDQQARLLIDTNIFLEILLEQDKSESCTAFFRDHDLSSCFVSDFTLHSIGVILFRYKRMHLFEEFLKDFLIDTGIGVLSLSIQSLSTIGTVCEKLNLDFDDAYQYACAKENNLKILSFDTHFDRTDLDRITP